ncbi:uncharacterized protein PAC_20021 [Phialocephala subalpina]|uniref:Heterokaryon incompatibility domain-containing protein n=1 Tax=Phialocephala subalpina TaxID=576137 RepID=A0A1L7XYP0_9HELO|nr:uncharacterized protein PAC_20021 [Phialocephala subalpina]
MASQIYLPIDPSTRQTRLININPSANHSATIECYLHTISVDHPPQYKALSYVWGNVNDFMQIRLNGEAFDVGVNLWHAIRRLRHQDKPEVFWIDAICINQNDIPERNAQVLIMGDIYEQAEEVVIWLGEEADDSSLAFELIRMWGRAGHLFFGSGDRVSTESEEAGTLLDNVSTRAFEPRCSLALLRLLIRPYWRRIWVLQEVARARTRTLVCGNDRLDISPLFAANSFWEKIDDPAFADLVKGADGFIYDAIIKLNTIRAFWHASHEVDTPVSIILYRTREFFATDPRDKIYGLLGLPALKSLHVKPDYSLTVEEVYTQFSHAVFDQLGQLAPFASVNGTLEITWQNFEDGVPENRQGFIDAILSQAAGSGRGREEEEVVAELA